MLIDRSEDPFNSIVQGIIGLRPITGMRAQDSGANFMRQLKRYGYIDELIVSFYMSKEHSIIKFGGWDKEGLENPDELMVLRTFDDDSWSIVIDEVNFD